MEVYDFARLVRTGTDTIPEMSPRAGDVIYILGGTASVKDSSVRIIFGMSDSDVIHIK